MPQEVLRLAHMFSSLLQASVEMRDTGRLSEAEAAAVAALQLRPNDPQARWALAAALLAQGRYAEGFPLLEARAEAFGHFRPALPYPVWTGEPVSRLLVWPEQGFGDQIQMARFAAVLAERCAVSWLCPAPLTRLFRASLPVEVIEIAQSFEFPDPDAWAMAFSLPAALGIARPEDVPSAPYLTPPAGAVARWKDFSAPGFNIGFAWRGNPSHRNDANRSLPSPDLLRAFAGLGALHDLTDPRGDFADTAAIVAQMDLIVTVDTALAHLAGAMGKRCFVFLPSKGSDWRWMSGDSSPWYPSLRLFGQTTPGDWQGPIREAVAAVSS